MRKNDPFNSKTFSDYGLSRAKEYPSALIDPAPEMLPRAHSRLAAKAQLAETLLGGETERVIQTPLEPVIMRRGVLEHITEKQNAARESFANYIIPSLVSPNEIWLTSYKDGPRLRFLKWFRGRKNMVAIVRKTGNDNLLWNAIPARHGYLDNQRKGNLLYRKK